MKSLDTIKDAVAALRGRASAEPELVATANLLDAVAGLAAREVMRCLDPRHGTTLAQAEAAVFDAEPFRQALELARAVAS